MPNRENGDGSSFSSHNWTFSLIIVYWIFLLSTLVSKSNRRITGDCVAGSELFAVRSRASKRSGNYQQISGDVPSDSEMRFSYIMSVISSSSISPILT